MNSLLLSYTQRYKARGLIFSFTGSFIAVLTVLAIGQTKFVAGFGSLLSLTAILGISLTLCLQPILDAKIGRNSWLDPLVIYAILYLLAYLIPGMLFLLNGGHDGFHARVMPVAPTDLVSFYTFTLLLALIGWLVVLALQSTRKIHATPTVNRFYVEKNIFRNFLIVLAGIFVLGAGTYSFIALYGSFSGFLSSFLLSIASRGEIWGNQEGTYAFIKFVDLIPYGLVWLLAPLMGRRSRTSNLWHVASWIAILAVGLMIFGRSGGRREMTLFIFQYLYLYHFLARKQIPKIGKYLLVLLVLVGVILIGSLRSIGPGELQSGARIFQIRDEVSLGLELDKLGMSSWVIDIFSTSNVNYLYGESLLAGPIMLINGWTNFVGIGTVIDVQPIGLNNYLGIWEKNDSTFTARSTSLLAEGYANYGPLGVVVFYLIFGLILRKLRNLHMQQSNVMAATLYCSACTIVIFAGVQSGLGGLFSRILSSWLPLAVVYLLIKYLSGGKSRRFNQRRSMKPSMTSLLSDPS